MSDNHIVEVALDADECAALRDPSPLGEHVRSRIADGQSQYYVLLDEVQYAISDEELSGTEPPRLYGVLNACCACEMSTSALPVATRSSSHLM